MNTHVVFSVQLICDLYGRKCFRNTLQVVNDDMEVQLVKGMLRKLSRHVVINTMQTPSSRENLCLPQFCLTNYVWF
ncbi:unnamed protein product [Trifolium pratense]|uniref:Uncharacterized protein n=3 Tax=Trifolium pratense TaxID=57577 RepID=A0ACB0K9J6_TRIPR|nr:unnamed protein product [Trifolium pratense]CAJ2652914.1 unnamed protein product [Trifolium pratense]CAJ2655867.1 unnamed protein product [Trifolium pratense]